MLPPHDTIFWPSQTATQACAAAPGPVAGRPAPRGPPALAACVAQAPRSAQIRGARKVCCTPPVAHACKPRMASVPPCLLVVGPGAPVGPRPAPPPSGPDSAPCSGRPPLPTGSLAGRAWRHPCQGRRARRYRDSWRGKLAPPPGSRVAEEVWPPPPEPHGLRPCSTESSSSPLYPEPASTGLPRPSAYGGQ